MKVLYVRPQNDSSKIESSIWKNFENDLMKDTGSYFGSSEIVYYDKSLKLGYIVNFCLQLIKKTADDKYEFIVLYGTNRISIFMGLFLSLGLVPSKAILLEFAYEGSLSNIKKTLYRIALNGYYMIGVCSDYEILRYKDEISMKSRVANIPAPIEKEYFQDHSICNVQNGYILSAGKSYRDYATLLGAAERMPNEKFVIISDYESLKHISVIPNNVEIKYNINRDDYFECIKLAKIVVVPVKECHRSAGHQVIYQAMAMGKPVVTTCIHSIKEFVADGVNGILVPENDSESMICAIKRLLSDSDLYEHCKVNGYLTAQDYSLGKYAECLYKTIVNTNHL